LETALSEWINDKKFIVVSSLSNNIDDFSFNPFLALNNEEIDVSQKTKLASEAYGSAKKLEQNLGIKTGLNS
jgi:hypothetical protein